MPDPRDQEVDALRRRIAALEAAADEWQITHERLEQAAEQASYERHLLQNLMDYLPDSIYFKDLQGRFVRINRGKAQRSGLRDPADAVGQSDADFFSPEHAREAAADEQQIIESSQPLLGKEEHLVWPDGQVTWVSTSKLPLYDDAGRIMGTFGVSRDITAQKRAAEALRIAKEAAEAANRAKSTFLANISHEIRTPLNAVIGMTELVLKSQLSAQQRDFLKSVKDSGEALLAVINDILDYSKIEAGKLVLERKPFDLWESLGDTIKSFALQAHQQSLELTCNIHRDVPRRVVGEYTRLRQILVNLLGNAIKFTEGGEVTLEVAVESWPTQDAPLRADGETPMAIGCQVSNVVRATGTDRRLVGSPEFTGKTPDSPDMTILRSNKPFEPDGTVPAAAQESKSTVDQTESAGEVVLQFTVSDTGIGIPADKQSVIFEMFEQVDSSTTRRYGGTGLGLAIAARLVALMDGRIWVESEVGRGSRFHFTARLGLTAEPAGKEALPDLTRFDGLRVLVVDDHATNRVVLAEMLRGWRMLPTMAACAGEATVLLRQARAAGQPYALVVTDAHMPDVDGFMLVEQIRHDAQLRSTVVMMLTSGDRPEDVARCEELRIGAYLLKPVKESELLDAVELALGFRLPPAESSAAAPMPATPSLRILLVEDSLVNQKLVVALLADRGHTIALARNGKAAMETLKSQEFDLILMDVQMPEMDGLEATSQIRTEERCTGRHTPIIAMTAHTHQDDRRRCLESGMDGVVTKPFRAHELYAEIVALGIQAAPMAVGEPRASVRIPEPSVLGAVNWAEALRAVGNDPTLLDAVARTAAEEIPELMVELRLATATGDAARLSRSAHTLAGVIRYFGAEQAANQAAELQQAGRRGNLDGAAPILTLFEGEISSLVGDLLNFIRPK